MTEYVLVPKRPTPEMIEAGCNASPNEYGFGVVPCVVHYRSMIAAAPQPEAVAPQGNVREAIETFAAFVAVKADEDLNVYKKSVDDLARELFGPLLRFALECHEHQQKFGLLSPPVGEGEWMKRAAKELLDYASNYDQRDYEVGTVAAIIVRHAPTSNEELVKALEDIIATDRRTSGTTSEDHTEYDGPCGSIARTALSKYRNR